VLLDWLGKPPIPPLASVANDTSAAHAVLEIFDRYWPTIAANGGLRQEAEGRVLEIVHAACRAPAEAETLAQLAFAWLRDLPLQGPVQRCWTPKQRHTLEGLLVGFEKAGNTYNTYALRAGLVRETAAPILKWLTWNFVLWVALWAAFLFAFPWSRTVQAVFFWNPKVRGMLSLWFVPLLLFCLPPLRRRLFAPFRDDLVAMAHLADFPRLAFFGQGRAHIGTDAPAAVETVLQGLRGAVVLRGDAGLGKTSALRWLAARSTAAPMPLRSRPFCVERWTRRRARKTVRRRNS
jgi:hypothetical protein